MLTELKEKKEIIVSEYKRKKKYKHLRERPFSFYFQDSRLFINYGNKWRVVSVYPFPKIIAYSSTIWNMEHSRYDEHY